MPVPASMNSALRRCIRFPGSDKAIPASGIDPAPHRLGGVGRGGVEADAGTRGEPVNQIENLLEQEHSLGRYAQAGADHHAIEAS